MPDVCHTFRTGHRIMVQVQSTWFPLVDRNPQTFVPNIFFAKPGDYNSRILLLVNGHRVNDNVFGQAEIGALHHGAGELVAAGDRRASPASARTAAAPGST